MGSDRVDKDRREFLTLSATAIGGVGLALASFPFLRSWWPSSREQAAGAPVQCDVSQLQPGQQVILPWQGKPVSVVRRSKEVLDKLKHESANLRDPLSKIDSQQPAYARNVYRSLVPEILVLVSVCTHLGCAPKYHPKRGELDASWPGGFYCPCHGSKFDMAGRVFKKVPAPVNLQVPPHSLSSDGQVVIIGQDPEEV